jgi:phosphatidylglycerophosphatase A
MWTMMEQLKFEGKWQRWVAFGFGSGLSPVAPGTAGTLVGVVVVVLLQFLPTAVSLLCTLFIVLCSIWIAGVVTRQMGIKDHPSIVIDEIAGYVVTMTMIPLTWWTVISGFLIFRLLDIYKPPPANWLDENCTGGFGITADDVVAGIYANLILNGLLYFVGAI